MIDLDLLEQIAQGAVENGEYESVLGPQMLALIRVVRAALVEVETLALAPSGKFPAEDELRAALEPFRAKVAA